MRILFIVLAIITGIAFGCMLMATLAAGASSHIVRANTYWYLAGWDVGLLVLLVFFVSKVRKMKYGRGRVRELLYTLIQKAAALGLPEEDVMSAREFVEYNERELAFDTVLTQLYEYNISIDHGFYDLVVEAGEELKISMEEYAYISKLLP